MAVADVIIIKIDSVFNDCNIHYTLQSAKNLVLRENYFKFNNKVYKQLKGMPMGSRAG